MKKNVLESRLIDNNIPYKNLQIGCNAFILIAQRGGRIFGPFFDAGDGLFWNNRLLYNSDSAAEILNSDEWNIGGDRLWFGPEIKYSVRDRNRFWETLHTPREIDPGDYHFNISEYSVELEQEFSICPAQNSSKRANVYVKRNIYCAANPLRNLHNLKNVLDNVEYCGFSQRIRIKGSGEPIEGWSLLQVEPGGEIYIPMYHPMRGVDYYEPAKEFEHVSTWGVKLDATGCNRYKVGYKSACVTGRIGYAFRYNKEACLLVRSFPNDPTGENLEEPPDLCGEHGFSIHVYNDSGDVNSFAELECSLPSLFGTDCRNSSDDIIETWIYKGNEEYLSQISKILLGIEIWKYGK